MLRERFGFKGEIRARGNVLQDQILFLARCGVDGFELEKCDLAGATEALHEFSYAYQRAADFEQPIWQQRLGRKKAA